MIQARISKVNKLAHVSKVKVLAIQSVNGFKHGMTDQVNMTLQKFKDQALFCVISIYLAIT